MEKITPLTDAEVTAMLASAKPVTWAELIGNTSYSEDLDYDDCYGREALDYRCAERDGWGTTLYWDGR